MFQEEIISIYGPVMVFHNPANEWKMRKGSWLPAIIEDRFVKRYKKMDQHNKAGEECFW